ncbi:hypothetical protein Vc3S01_2608 [Vibrio campbellii]|nr:hypothetical protein Vc3S01_2608 [Vibrio campbellii]EDL69131.1 hypothetical protein A1Q_1991 [Vibrio campbellii HY01]
MLISYKGSVMAYALINLVHIEEERCDVDLIFNPDQINE